MLTLTSTLLIVCPMAFLILAVRKKGSAFEESNRLLVILAYVFPAVVLVLYASLWRSDATRVLIELRGIAFRSLGGAPVRKAVSEREAGRGRIVVGDVPRNGVGGDVRLLGSLLFRPAQNDAGTLTVELPAPGLRAGIISTKDDGMIGAAALEDGDRICVASACWTYREDDPALVGNGESIPIPPRQTRIPGMQRAFTLPFAPPFSARSRTYPLQWLASRGSASATAGRVRSFLCYADPGHRLRLVLLDDDVFVVRGGKRVAFPDSAVVQEDARLTLFTLPAATETFEGPGITERRSVVYRAGPRSYVLELDTSEIRSLTVEELRSLGIGTEAEREKQLLVSLSMGSAQMVDRGVYLSGISESVALQASSLFELAPSFPRIAGSSWRIVSPRGPAGAKLGETVWIGATDLAAIRFDVLRPPLLLLAFGLLLAMVKALVAVRARFNTQQVLLAAVLETLVGIRLLISYRAWAMPPHLSEAFDLGLIAWMTLPWLFLAVSMPPDPAAQRPLSVTSIAIHEWTLTGAGLLLSLVFSWRILEGRMRIVWLAIHALAVAVAALRQPFVRERLVTVRAKLAARTAAIRTRIANLRAVSWSAARLRLLGEERMLGVVVAGLVICLVRLVLLLAGSKEALLGTGGRISLSAIHIPAAVIVQGVFFYRLWERAKGKAVSWLHIGVAWSLLLLVWVIPALGTSDIGLALLNIPVFALMFVAVHKHVTRPDLLPEERPTRLRRLTIWMPLAGVCVVVLLAPLVRFLVPLAFNEEKMLALASDANYARFLHFAEPDRLRQLATKRGESLAITSAILQSYIDSGFFGRGYGASEVTPLLGDTAFRDFAPAVFIAAEWGFVGTAALLIVYALFFVLGIHIAPWSEAGGGMPAAIGCVAAATVAVSSIYMVLANHELLLLTGKNAYLLGLDSAGDLVEFAFLLFLIAVGASSPLGRRVSSPFGGWP